VKDLDSLKAEFKRLIFYYHPDRNDSEDATRITQEIISEYNYLLNTSDFSTSAIDFDIENEFCERDTYLNIINTLSKIDGIIIEVIGHWIWVSGNTFANKEILKELKFMFASKKKMWFYRDEDKKTRNKGVTLSIEQIRERHEVKAVIHGNSNFGSYAISN